MKKLKHEKELVKLALDTVMVIAEKQGVVEFEATDSSKEKIEYVVGAIKEFVYKKS